MQSATPVPPEPLLSDGVVTLRPWAERDVEALPRLIGLDEEIARWLDRLPSPYGPADARAWVEHATEVWRAGTGAPFVIVDAGRGEVAGGIGFNMFDREDAVGEVGYWLSSAARGRGLMTRALRLLVAWGFEELGLQRIQLRAVEQNVASCRVAERAGFVREGVHRSEHWNARQGRRVDFVMYSLLPGELV